MNICVVGSGYVGLVTGACLADFGNTVTCVDKVRARIDALLDGKIPIFEPGLESLVRKNTAEDRLRFTTDLGSAIAQASAIFIAVGTPPDPTTGAADLSAIHEVAKSIGQHLNGFKVVVTKSTVPAGTGREIEAIIAEHCGRKHAFAVVSNPEFLREGSAIDDFLKPDRVVIGTRDPRALEVMRQIYAPLKADVPFVETNVESAELIKYASNGFLATKISFINETAALCEAFGADVSVVARGMGLDSRIGPRFLHPGPGFGGSCFPKDTQAVSQLAQQKGLKFRIIDAVLAANEATKARMLDKIREALGGDLAGRTLGVLGLSFKPDTDDVRESPALTVVAGLLAGGARVQAYDPEAMPACQKLPEFAAVTYCDNAYETAEGADALVILTEWNQFRALELRRLRELLAQPLVIDLRNIYEPARMAAAGFHYVSVGRPTQPAVASQEEGEDEHGE